MGNPFFRKMAAGNVRRSREVYLPYLLAAAIIGCVYFLVVSMSFSENLTGVPGGEQARLMFAMGTTVFTIFAFCFLLSINRFLIKQRKKEFGLYGVLGLSKGHVGRILIWENAIVLLGGLGLGLVFALVFGKLFCRFLYKIQFNRPTVDARAQIWQAMLPSLTENDAQTLASQFDLSGGEIENITRKYTVNAILSGQDGIDLQSIIEICRNERISDSVKAKIGFRI